MKDMKEEFIKKGMELITYRDKLKNIYDMFVIDFTNKTITSILFKDQTDIHLYSIEDAEFIERLNEEYIERLRVKISELNAQIKNL